MPRAKFDTTCDFIYGPSGALPGIVWNSCDCRVVPLLTEIPSVLPLLLCSAYITIPGPPPNSPAVVSTPPIYTWNLDYADRIAVPSGSSANWLVLWTESIQWRRQALYYRARVQPIGFVGTVSFPSSSGPTTFTVPAGTSTLYCELVGPGGVGGIQTLAGGGGGGGGAYAYGVHGVAPGDVISVFPGVASVQFPSGDILAANAGGPGAAGGGGSAGTADAVGPGWTNLVLNDGGYGGSVLSATGGAGGGGAGGSLGRGKHALNSFTSVGSVGGVSGGLPGGYGGSMGQNGFNLGGGGGGQPAGVMTRTIGGGGIVTISWS